MGEDLVMLGRILLAAILGYAVGWEREFRGKAAGGRTFALVTIGSAAFTAVGVENFPASAEKVIAGVVTGIGFLGAGLIVNDRGGVRGLTTAAALWSSAAIGVLLGSAEYFLAVGSTLIVLALLEAVHLPLVRQLEGRVLHRQMGPAEARREGGLPEPPDPEDD